jgi:hypothetical protein
MPEPIKQTVWKRAPNPDSLREKNRFAPEEEERVRAGLDVLRIRYGNWKHVADALKTHVSSITRTIGPKGRVTPAFAMRIARLLGVPLGDVLSGAFPRAGQCPLCGHRTHSKVVAAGTKETVRETVARLKTLRFGSR